MKIQIKVKPNARQSSIVELEDGTLLTSLKSAPVDGKANKELIKLLADRFDLHKSSIAIKSGLSSKIKLVEIELE
jgi:uncharacterized protein